MQIYVLTHDLTDPLVFAHHSDAEAYAQARWGDDWYDVAILEEQSLIDCELALQMISEELEEQELR